MATWSRHLHDVFYLYGLSLNDSLTQDPIGGQSNAFFISESMKRSFVGLTGLVTISQNGTRIPLFSVYVLDTNFNQVTAINFTVIDGQTTMSKGYTNEATTLWATRGGQRPLVRPKCGYTGTECPKPFWELYGLYIIVASGLLLILLTAAVIFIIYVISVNCKQQSKRSLQSGPSIMTGDSKLTESNFGDFELHFLENDPVLTTKYPATGLTEEDRSRFPQELISKGSLWFDPFFMLCIMRDIAEGLRYLHGSFIESHGRLRSECCLVTDSWQVKISDYGIGSLREDERLKKK
ncbi:hypothetical protein OSTOST_22044, partial [Ostertagia ostertagi]